MEKGGRSFRYSVARGLKSSLALLIYIVALARRSDQVVDLEKRHRTYCLKIKKFAFAEENFLERFPIKRSDAWLILNVCYWD